MIDILVAPHDWRFVQTLGAHARPQMSRSCCPLIVVSPASLTDTARSRSQGRCGRARSPDQGTRQSFVLDDDHERRCDVAHLGGRQPALPLNELTGVEALDLHDVGGLDPLEPVGLRRLDAHDPVPVGESVLPALQRHDDLDWHVAHGVGADYDVRTLLPVSYTHLTLPTNR